MIQACLGQSCEVQCQGYAICFLVLFEKCWKRKRRARWDKKILHPGLIDPEGLQMCRCSERIQCSCFHVIPLQLPKLTLSYSATLVLQSPLWLVFNGRSHDSMTHCQVFTSKHSYASVLFLVSNVATEMQEKDFRESYFQPYRFQNLPCFCLRRERCLCRFQVSQHKMIQGKVFGVLASGSYLP